MEASVAVMEGGAEWAVGAGGETGAVRTGAGTAGEAGTGFCCASGLMRAAAGCVAASISSSLNAPSVRDSSSSGTACNRDGDVQLKSGYKRRGAYRDARGGTDAVCVRRTRACREASGVQDWACALPSRLQVWMIW
jgi:hypothetical protein